MRSFVIYLNTCEIIRWGSTIDNFMEGESEIDTVQGQISNPEENALEAVGTQGTHYIDLSSDPVCVQRPELEYLVTTGIILADGIDSSTVTGIPEDWEFTLDNGDPMLTDGTDVVFTAIEPGDYVLRFTKWPYLDVEVVIHADPAV
jgi:hypothetical protein